MQLTVKKLNKSYGKVKAISDFSAEFTNGIYGLLGANGAGKTTLIKLLCGISSKDSGKIEFNNKEIQTIDLQYKDNIGYLPQEFLGYPEFTGENFLEYVATIKGVGKTEILNRVEEVLKSVNLYNLKEKKIKTYSGGMKRRLGIAQAIINYPQILILDEPTAGLDPKERAYFRNIISEYGKQHVVILSTHIVSDIEYVAKEIMVIKDGKLLNKGKTEKIVSIMNGKVWEGKMSKDLEKVLKNKIIINIKNEEEEGGTVRFISDGQLAKDVYSVNPTLEDLYLYYFN